MDKISETVGRVKRAAIKKKLADALPKQPPAEKPALEPRATQVLEKGIKDIDDVMQAMSLLMADIITQRVATGVANTLCSAVGKMMKAAELKERYGKPRAGSDEKVLKLAS